MAALSLLKIKAIHSDRVLWTQYSQVINALELCKWKLRCDAIYSRAGEVLLIIPTPPPIFNWSPPNLKVKRTNVTKFHKSIVACWHQIA